MILDPARITFPLKPIIFDEEVNVVRACFRYFRQCFDESWSCVAILLPGRLVLSQQAGPAAWLLQHQCILPTGSLSGSA